MTIHELLQAAGLTANDEIPIWDADGTGEPTKKITAQQLAAAVVTLANLVTSVNNQTGAVSITPANIGAPTTTGSGASGTWGINVSGGANVLAPTGFQYSCLSYRQSDDTFFGSASGWEHFIICNHGDGSTYFNYTIGLPFWGKPQYKRQTGSQSAQSPWYEFLTTESPVLVTEGGTGATTPAQARANLGITPANIGAVSTSDVIDVAHGGTGATTPAAARANLGITPANIGAVAKTGDTMTGDLTVQHSGEVNIHAKSTTTGVDIALESAASGNQGVWSFGYWNGSSLVNDGKWLVYRNTNGKIIFNDTLDIAHGGTGKTTNWEGLAALSTPRVNTTWKDAPVGVSVFKYEGDTSSFDVPGTSFVVVIKESNARGVAYAIRWADPSTALWISHLHDDSGQNNWSAWKTIVDTNGAVPVASGGTNATTPAQARANLEITPANIGAVAKSGDTMTGALTAQSISVKANLPMYYLRDENNLDYAHMRGDNTDHHIIFRMTTPGTNSAYEDYSIPIPTNQSSGIGYDILTTKSPVLVTQGGTGATDAPGARANLGIATTLTTFQTEGITANGNFDTGLKPSRHVIDAIYCTAGYIAITPYSNGSDKWFAHCIHPTTGAPITSNFNVTIRYHNIY